MQNYTKNALALCYIARNFQDVRKLGDGDRIIRLYEFLLIYFKIDGRTKCAYQYLHLLAQISCLLPPSLAFELKWNRFVNTKGTIDGKVEFDRHLEHLNKYVKADLAQFQGKITEKSIARCSRSYFKMQKITDYFDKQLGVVSPSGRHSSTSWEEDVKQLGEQYIKANIFDYQHGRFHSRFPGFPKNYQSLLDVLTFKKWAFKKLREFKCMNIYKLDDIVTYPTFT